MITRKQVEQLAINTGFKNESYQNDMWLCWGGSELYVDIKVNEYTEDELPDLEVKLIALRKRMESL